MIILLVITLTGVRTYTHPFKYSELKRLFYTVTERKTFLINPLSAIFNLGFIAASFVLLLIEERSGKTFHLQLVCGMSRAVYWITTAFWDLCTYFLFTVVILLLYMAFQVGGIGGRKEGGRGEYCML